MQKTINALAGAGLIEQRPAHFEAVKVQQGIELTDYINMAGAELTAGRWRRALGQLRDAEECQRVIDAMAWFVTDAGRAAIGATRQ